MSKYWSNAIKDIEPYVPGEQPKDRRYIKLNTNESPYPPSPKVLEAIGRAAGENLKLYPDPTCDNLRSAAAEYYGLDKDQVFIGNGSDELLTFSYLAFFNPGNPILFPDITYSFYPVYCKLFNIDYKLVTLDENFDMPVEMFYQENGGVIFPNPNAPTAKYLELERVRDIIENNPQSVVIVDEAYIDFGGQSAISLINDYPNLLVIQTLSKSRCLAGLRVGFAFGQRELMEGLDRVKNSINSYTLDSIALAGAEAAIRDVAYFNGTRQKVIGTRERVSVQLKDLGFKVIDSKANFLFISHMSVSAVDLFTRLRESGILVRYFNKPRIDNFLRVTIGTDGEMDCLVDALREITGP